MTSMKDTNDDSRAPTYQLIHVDNETSGKPGGVQKMKMVTQYRKQVNTVYEQMRQELLHLGCFFYGGHFSNLFGATPLNGTVT